MSETERERERDRTRERERERERERDIRDVACLRHESPRTLPRITGDQKKNLDETEGVEEGC